MSSKDNIIDSWEKFSEFNQVISEMQKNGEVDIVQNGNDIKVRGKLKVGLSKWRGCYGSIKG